MSLLKNVDNKNKMTWIISALFIVGCTIISLGSLIVATQMVDDANNKVYVLDSNVPVLVKQTDMSETLDLEAKSHVEMFHNFFFSLAPDEKYIDYTMEKAMYLIDESGLAQYNALREEGLYSKMVGRSAMMSIVCDSIHFDEDAMHFIYYGRQRIELRSKIQWRTLVSEGYLKRMPRTEHNPHGFIITKWRINDNSDLSSKKKDTY